MGTKYTYGCNKCGYKALTSGGHDFGFFAVVDTYICKSCKEIVDVTVGKEGVTYTREEAASQREKQRYDLDYYTCPNCRSGDNLTKWDDIRKPCPRCDGSLDKEMDGHIILWD